MKKSLLILLLSVAILLPGIAQQRTEAEAAAIAKAFMQNNGYDDFSITKSSKINKVLTEKAGEITPYYIFNDTQKGGFVIVGGQEGMSDILAYSDEDCFNVDDMPPAAQMWLDIYAKSAIKAADYPEESKAEKRAAAKAFLKSDFVLRKNVQPLLGEIKYNQGEPYNIMCPMLTESKIQNGDTTSRTALCVTGCTQTAQAMLMRYWKWPIRPKGSKTHIYNYDRYKNYDMPNAKGEPTITTAKDTLSINFDEEPEYDWDNMIPRYQSVTRTTDDSLRARQDTAVARLMLHCGISNGAGYGHGGTGAALCIEEMVKYFSYAKDYISDSYSNYKTKGDDAYRAMLADELSQGRPIWSAGSEPSGGAHCYIVDGFDMNALFHFNLGWNGSSNGYYEVAPVPEAPYGHGMWFKRHIHPEGRLTPTEPTRRHIFEAGGGSWNKKFSTIHSAWKKINTDNKYGETIICILTSATEEDAENYLPGLSSVDGFLINRCDTATGTISEKSVTKTYEEHMNSIAPALIDVDAMYTSDSTMLANVTTQFPYSHNDADYRIAFVYTENNVLINGAMYNYVARGSYPGKEGFTDCFPETIEQDVQYIYEKEIPLPSTIKSTGNTTLIAMLINGKTGAIENANTINLKQINTWKSNQKPAFSNGEKILDASSTVDVYKFDEEKSRMLMPIKIHNPWYEVMPVEVTAEVVELAENAQIQIGETEGNTTAKYNLTANGVDSTMMLYLNITDKLQSSKSSVKLVLKYKNKTIAEQIVNFEFIESVEGLNPYTVRVKGTLADIVPATAKDTITTITLGGRLCGNDIIYLRDSLPNLKVIDMAKAKIVAGPGEYYLKNKTQNDTIGVRFFQGMNNIEKVTLPESVKIIANNAFYNSKALNSVVIGEKVSYLGASAFQGCTALEEITIPASLKDIGRNAFKGASALKCVICKSETPPTLGATAFSGVDQANATLVVPNEEAIEAYKANKQFAQFGNIITYNQHTSIIAVSQEAGVSVKAGKIIVANDEEVAIYTIAGKLVAKGKAGEYALPAGNYIVKVGNNAVKVKL